MRVSVAASLLALLAGGLCGCREEPGRCSSEQSRLCVEARLDPGVLEPDALLVDAVPNVGAPIKNASLPGVAAAFRERQRYVLEIDLKPASMATQVVLTLVARRGGTDVATGSATWRRGDQARPLVVTLRAVGGGGGDLAQADLASVDLASVDLASVDLGPSGGFVEDFVLGQGTLKSPTDVCYSGSRLYVSDTGYHRVLVFPMVRPGASATIAVGQLNLTAVAPPAMPSADRMNSPRGLWCDANFLLVADSGHNRVLFFDQPPAASGAAAVGVAGQANFTVGSANRGGAVGANTLFNPRGVFWDGARLYIADRNNNRVVIYDAPNRAALGSLASANAVAVLGQTSFTGNMPSSGQGGLSGPEGVFSTGSRIAVAEVDNNRVTVFNLPGGLSGPADAAYGQPNLAGTNPRSARDGLSGPSVVRVTIGARTIIADRLSHRVLIFNSGLIGPGIFAPPAEMVLGQPSFTDAAPTQLNRPGGVAVLPDPGGLLVVVADEGNGRLVVFRKPN